MFEEIKTWSDLSGSEQRLLLTRPAVSGDAEIKGQAEGIINTVRRNGDRALLDYAARFDGCDLTSLKVTDSELAAAEETLETRTLEAIDFAIANVRRFHEAQRPVDIALETVPGVRCERRSHAIDAVGLYVPAGTAPLPSTAVMLCVPAAIAGCPRRILCTPPDETGTVDAATLVAARRCGVSDIYKIGGAQAVAAMAYGTETIPAVDRIFGPGNSWVTAAKSIVATDPRAASIDMPAGPSELLVIADDSASAKLLAADLLSQAEHGEDSQVILLSTCRETAENTVREIGTQLSRLTRKGVASKALSGSRVIVAASVDEAINISNRYAPEHLLLQIRDARESLKKVRNAGSVFVGKWSPESVGDYCSGTNHVLPTYGSARSISGLGVENFMRQMTIQELTEDGLRRLAPAVLELAKIEGLDAHAEAVRVRLN